MKKRAIWVGAAIFCFFCQSASADTIFLKRGGTIDGEVVEGESTVEVRMAGGSATFTKNEIDRIEKSGSHPGDPSGAVSDSMSKFKSGAEKVIQKAQAQSSRALQNVKKTTANWMKPVQRSAGAKATEKMTNDALMEMQTSLKKLHAREKAIAQQKRELKKDGFEGF